jgi:hypothetical protein
MRRKTQLSYPKPMSTGNPFPPLPSSTPLSKEQVIGELTVLEKEGWEVFSVDPHFVIKVDDATTLWLLPHGETHCQIQPESTLGRKFVAHYARDLPELRHILRQFLGQARPTTTRLVAGQPASNVAWIQTLIGSAQVQAVHDPYLDDKGLDTLRILFRLGVHTIPNLRLITDRSSNRLTEAFAKAFLSEFGCQAGEVRRSAAANPHRRFMLLSGGQSLILGLSLNDINKDEAAHLENDLQDRPFFEQEWNAGTLVVCL